ATSCARRPTCRSSRASRSCSPCWASICWATDCATCSIPRRSREMTSGVIDAGTRRPHHANMLRIAFAGTFAATLEPAVRAQLTLPCEIILADEASVAGKLGDVDVLVSLAFTREMAAVAGRLKLVQVPGAGLDRIDRMAVGASTALANVYGHEVGIAEYTLGAMLTLARQLGRLD